MKIRETICGIHARATLAKSEVESNADVQRSMAAQRIALVSLALGLAIASPYAHADLISIFGKFGTVIQAGLNLLTYALYAVGFGTFAWSIMGLVKLANKDPQTSGMWVAAAFFGGPLLAVSGWLLDQVLESTTGTSSSNAQNHASFSGS